MDLSARLAIRSEPVTMTTSTTTSLLITLLVIVLVGLFCGIALFFLRRHRLAKRQSEGLPVYNDEKLATTQEKSHRRRLSGLILSSSTFRRHSKPIFVYKATQLADGSASPLPSPLPEIRITFPDEVDDSGKRNSGRVYVARIGEQGALGLEPLDDNLPSYQKDHIERFQSLDLERIGGLKEKAPPTPPPKA